MNYYKNILVNYVFTFVKNIDLTNGIWMLYLASKGLSLFEIGLLEGIFHVTSMIMETPTGAIADIFGRKTSRIIGVVFSIISKALMIISNSFAQVAISFALAALSYNFESGAGEALVYDSLLLEKKEKLYIKITGRNELILQITGILGLIVGGIVGNIRYEFVYFIAVGVSIAALVIGFFFKEPLMKKPEANKKLGKAMIKQYKDSFNAIRGNARLFYLILFTAVLCSSVTLSFYYIQIAWEKSLSVLGIGLYLAVSFLAAAIGAFYADKLEKRFGEKFILKITPVILTLSVFALHFTDWALLPFCVMNILETVVYVATRDYINSMIPSDKRATILSFESMMFSVVMILIFPLFGLISDNLGINNTFLLLGGVMLVMSAVNLKLTKGRGTELLRQEV